MTASDVAQDHEEGVVGKLPGLGRKTLGPPLLMHLQLLDQLVEEDSQLGAWNLVLAERESWAIHTHCHSLGSKVFSDVEQALDPEADLLGLIL